MARPPVRCSPVRRRGSGFDGRQDRHAAGFQTESRRTERTSIQIGQVARDFETDTTQGRIRFHEWLGPFWGVLFSHPKDFTPVCTTGLGTMAHLAPEFAKRDVKLIGLSVDRVDSHSGWSEDIEEVMGRAPNFPMSTGRNFDEILRVIDSLRLTAGRKLATPANWRPGDRAIIAGSVSD